MVGAIIMGLNLRGPVDEFEEINGEGETGGIKERMRGWPVMMLNWRRRWPNWG